MNLNYKDEGHGPPLIILHGLFGSMTNWRGIASRLKVSFRVITVDLRNHGRSDWSDDVSYESMAADIIALGNDLELDEVILLGHSMGGKTAMAAALLYPERVAGLVVVDIAPISYNHSHETLINTLLKVDLDTINNRQDLDRVLSRDIAEKGLRMFLSQNLVAAEGGFKWRVNLRGLSEGMGSLVGFPDFDVRRFEKPSLFLYGRQSNYVTEAYQGEIDRYFPNAHMEAIDEAGHWLHAEKPQRVIDAVHEFGHGINSQG
ncbi:MAG: alpha/beta hydrolase [marine bacterium B5-7]|nr:MAG: alpha/beta hydrolase [marine bacterium B5-7]